MPTYHYRCKSCSYEFEELQRISEEPLKVCPSCKKETVVRILSGGAGLVFKGSGFYQTDYKKSGGAGSKESSEKPSKKPESKGDSPSGTKPDSTSSGSGSTKPKNDSPG